jgi:hypothetical protein
LFQVVLTGDRRYSIKRGPHLVDFVVGSFLGVAQSGDSVDTLELVQQLDKQLGQAWVLEWDHQERGQVWILEWDLGLDQPWGQALGSEVGPREEPGVGPGVGPPGGSGVGAGMGPAVGQVWALELDQQWVQV